MLLSFLYISFRFLANLRREITISQVLQRTWTHSREFEFSYLPLTPYLEIQFLGSSASFKKLNKQWGNTLTKLELAILSDVFATVASKIFNSLMTYTPIVVKMYLTLFFLGISRDESARHIYFEHIVFARPVSFQIQNGGRMIKVQWHFSKL